MKKLFLPALTKMINTYLQLDPASNQRLMKLQDRVVTMEFLPFHILFQCRFTTDGVTVSAEEIEQACTIIRGTPLQMLGVMVNKDQRQRFFAEDLSIEGDVELGQQVVALFDELEVDWEEQISQVIGDVPAYHMGRFASKLKTWFSETEKKWAEDVSDYVQEEAKWLPPQEAMQDFFSDVDILRMDVDRMDARVAELQAHLIDDEEAQ